MRGACRLGSAARRWSRGTSGGAPGPSRTLSITAGGSPLPGARPPANEGAPPPTLPMVATPDIEAGMYYDRAAPGASLPHEDDRGRQADRGVRRLPRRRWGLVLGE